jgi:hypothetical protein
MFNKKLVLCFSFLFLTACGSLTPKDVSNGLKFCWEQELEGIVVVREGKIKSVMCVPDEALGYIDMGNLDLVQLPRLSDKHKEGFYLNR